MATRCACSARRTASSMRMGCARAAHSGRARLRADSRRSGSGTAPLPGTIARAHRWCSGTRPDTPRCASSVSIDHLAMAPLTLTILGAGPAAPNPGGANSGYLVRQGDTAVVMDCGPGTAGQIALHVAPTRLDGLAISHFHPDHYFDLIAVYYLTKFHQGTPREGRLPVWVPP